MELPKRKKIRLSDYDYTTGGAYFITLCTKNRQNLLCDIVGEGLCALPNIILTPIGDVVKNSIEYINQRYNNVKVDKWVIMPDHLHLLIRIENKTGGHGDPPLQNIIAGLKSFTTHEYGKELWQRSFYDHIIRNQSEYNEIWEYIDENPLRWLNKKTTAD